MTDDVRLIDANELQKLFNQASTALLRDPILTKDHEHMIRAFLMTTQMIQDAPTVDAMPIKHGHWIYEERNACNGDVFVRCSACKRAMSEGKQIGDVRKLCPNCGARMDEVAND